MNAEQRILAWLERADFDGTGCRHSQDTIAEAVGCTRRTVIRATQSLAAQGLITIGKERRAGCKWLCNVYQVRNWNPQKRAGVLNVLASISERRRARCHTEGKATTVEGSCVYDTSPSLPSTYCRDAARRRANGEIQGRGRCMCDECQRLQDHLLGATETMNAQGRELAKLRRELSIEQATSPTAMQVQKALEFWAEGRAGKPNLSSHGGRARLVRQAIQLGHTNPALACPVHGEDGRRIRGAPKDAQCTVVDEIIEALAGLKLVPFVGPNGGRTGEGVVGAKRYDDVKYALTDRKSGAVSEDTIEHMRGVWRRHRMWSAEKLWQAYLATSEVAERWLRLAVDAINREQARQQQAKRADVIDLASRRMAS